jgi:AmmeMemoRadiSam system protein B
MDIRKPMFAGSWYPSDPKRCEKEILAFLDEPLETPPPGMPLVGGIVPHAGWFFSGSLACRVIHALSRDRAPDVVAIFGMHLGVGSPNYIMPDGGWETPFGVLEVENRLAGDLVRQFDFIVETPISYTQDNTIELQLPFIKYFWGNTKILPVGVSPKEESFQIGTAVVDAAKQLGLSIKVIGSTDLTHYGVNYGFTTHGRGAEALDWVRHENDRRVIEAMLNMEPDKVMKEALANHNACCAGAVATALSAGRHMGAEKSAMIGYATSYDKSPGDSFVGYVGIVF